MFTTERVGLNSPLGIIIACGDLRETFFLPTPNDAVSEPLDHEQAAGLIVHPNPGIAEFGKVRKVLIRKSFLSQHKVSIELRAFRWWGDWYEDLLIESDDFTESALLAPSDQEWSPEPQFDISTIQFHSRRRSPLRVLEIRIEEQRWYAIEVPQLIDGMSPINPYAYEPWKGNAWVPYLVSSNDGQSQFRKLIEYLSHDCA